MIFNIYQNNEFVGQTAEPQAVVSMLWTMGYKVPSFIEVLDSKALGFVQVPDAGVEIKLETKI